MAKSKAKKRLTARVMLSRMLKNNVKNRRQNRRMRKYRRSRSYWQQHSELLFSKVILRDMEALWFDLNYPHLMPQLRMVNNPEQYPRYRQGLWDGQAFFVQFTNREEVGVFKNSLWNQRR